MARGPVRGDRGGVPGRWRAARRSSLGAGGTLLHFGQHLKAVGLNGAAASCADSIGTFLHPLQRPWDGRVTNPFPLLQVPVEVLVLEACHTVRVVSAPAGQQGKGRGGGG